MRNFDLVTAEVNTDQTEFTYQAQYMKDTLILKVSVILVIIISTRLYGAF